MKKSLIEIYALAVCFVAVVCFTISLGVGIYDLIEITNPEFTLKSYQYEQHQSNEKFIERWPKDKTIPSDEEITRQRLQSYKLALQGERREAFQSLTSISIIIIINIVVFLIHWIIAKRTRCKELES